MSISLGILEPFDIIRVVETGQILAKNIKV